MDREDIYELDELEKIIDTDNIPFEKLIRVFIDFIFDELITKDNLQKLNIDTSIDKMIIRYALQGKAFLEGQLTQEELLRERVSAWKNYKGLAYGSMSQNLLRIVICCLYDRKASEFDKYGSESDFELYFSLMLGLGSGYCRKFRYYIQNNLVL